MGKRRSGARRRLKLVTAFALALALAAGFARPAAAAPVRTGTSWTDTFDSTRGIDGFSGTRVGGDALKLAEGAATDLGEPVPGESAVYAVLSTDLGDDNSVFCGTGGKGHLVEYDPGELFQESFQGPSHRGVSSSRGQAVTSTKPPQTRVTALVRSGSIVIGGTHPDGHLFSFDPSVDGAPPADLGTCPGAAGAVLSLACGAPLVYAGTDAGDLFTYDSGSFALLGKPSGDESPVNALYFSGGFLYVGSGDGHLYRYGGGGPGAFDDLGDAGAGPVNSLAGIGTVIYLATGTAGGSDGGLFSYDTGAPGVFNDLGNAGSGSAMKAVAVSGTSVYVGREDGHVHLYDGGWPADADQGMPANAGGEPVNSLSVGPDGVLYGGTGSGGESGTGRLFRMSGYEEYGTAPGGDPLTSVGYFQKKLYAGNQAGDLYTYTSSDPDTYNHLGNAGGSRLNDMDSLTGHLYLGAENGNLYSYSDDDGIETVGAAETPSPMNAVLCYEDPNRFHVYAGQEDGGLLLFDVKEDPDPEPQLLATLPGGAAVLDMAWRDYGARSIYLAGSDGKLYLYDGGLHDLGGADGAVAMRGLAVPDGTAYAGYADGKLFSFDGASWSGELADCGSPVTSMAPGNQGVVIGTSDGRTLVYDTMLREFGAAPGGGAVKSLCHVNDYVVGGTANGGLFSHDDAWLADRGQQVKRQIMIWCMAYDPGKKLFYAGTYRNAHFLVIDLEAGTVIDRGRPIDGEREIEDILVASDGTVYGATYGGTEEYHNPDGGHLFTYDPETGAFDDLGRAPAPDGNWWISSLVEGDDSKIYCSTSNSAHDATHYEGRLFVYEPGSGSSDLGCPVDDEGTRTLTVLDGKIYGATWDPTDNTISSVYVFEPGSWPPERLGSAPARPDGMGPADLYVNRLYPCGGLVYGAQNNGFVFEFDPGEAYEPVVLGKPVSSSTSVFPISSGQETDSFLCGTTADTGGGHLVSYDPGLGEFRDIAVLGDPFQDRVASIARDDGSGTTLCGTRSRQMFASTEYYAARLYSIPAYVTGGGQAAISVDVKPGVRELTPPVPGAESIGALCAAPGDAKRVYGGTAGPQGGPDAEMFIYDTMTGDTVRRVTVPGGHERVGALCASEDGRVYLGTADSTSGGIAELFRYDPADPDVLESLGGGEWDTYHGIFSLAVGANGHVYIGVGDSPDGETFDPGRLFEYDPGSGRYTDRGAVTGTGRIAALVPASNGRVYGGTGMSPGQTGGAAHFVEYNPATGTLNESVPHEFGNDTSIHSMATGPDGKIYCGSGPAGRLVSYDIAAGTFTWEQSGWPYSGLSVTALTSTADAVVGCAGDRGGLFEFVPGSGSRDMGRVTCGGGRVLAAATDNLGKPFFGSEGTDALVRYDPDMRFEWSTVEYSATVPPDTGLSIDVLDETGTVDLLTGVTAGQGISELSPDNRGLRLRGNFFSSDPTVTPTVGDWGFTWEPLPNVDTTSPTSAYRGDLLYIWGSNFGTVPGTVTVGGQAAALPGLWTDNCIQVEVPGSASDGSIVVDLGGGKQATGSFTLLDPPHLDRIEPARAHVGDVLELRGTSFLDEKQGDDYVMCNGTAATQYLLWSDTLIRIRVPTGATTGPVTVGVDGHVSNAKTLTVISGGGPAVEVTGPADGQSVSGRVVISADVRSSEAVKKVEFLVDGALVGTDTSAPYACTWDSDAAVDGGRLVTARATDAAGRRGSDSITSFVNHTVPTASTTWYFAEGCTDYGFETWILVGNPGDARTVAHVTFMDDEGKTFRSVVDLPPHSRATVNAADAAGAANLSAEVRSDNEVVCERAMYWDGRVEGHDSVGASALSGEWYFAEGCTDYGFETWLLLGNPSDSASEATVEYLFPDGTRRETAHTVEPRSRLTVDTAGEVGAGEFSMRVTATGDGLVAERAVYYGSRRCGTGTVGCPAPATSWFLSEGSSDWGFETWLLIGRPAAGDAHVTATYHKGDGQTVTRRYTVTGNSRYTVNLADEVGTADASTQVTSDVPVVCERAMYWNGRSAGHCTVGSPGTSMTWYLAEGCTDYGFETWLLLDNPHDEEVGAQLMFLTQGGDAVPFAVTVPPHARLSVDTSALLPGSSFSTAVTSELPLMCERAVYWSGRSGGTGSIGAR